VPDSLVTMKPKDLPKHELITDLFDDVFKPVNMKNFPAFMPNSPLKEYMKANSQDNLSESDHNLILTRSELYLQLSSEFGANYLPHPRRADYLSKNDVIAKRRRDNFKQDKIINDIEKQLNEYLNNKSIYCTYPLLFDYIRRNADPPDSPIEQLRVAWFT